jgi:hypothetical protein
MLDAFGSMAVSAKASGASAAPYVQLLSLTNDSAAAHQEFVKVRESNSTGSGKKNAGTSARLGGGMGGVAAALLVAALGVTML